MGLVAGYFSDAKAVRNKASEKLQKLGLTPNIEKSRITSLRNGRCRFLGMDFYMRKNTTIRQRFASRIILHAPILELLNKLKEKSFVKRNTKGEFFPIGKSNRISLTHFQILDYFNSHIRGILNYYSCVQ